MFLRPQPRRARTTLSDPSSSVSLSSLSLVHVSFTNLFYLYFWFKLYVMFRAPNSSMLLDYCWQHLMCMCVSIYLLTFLHAFLQLSSRSSGLQLAEAWRTLIIIQARRSIFNMRISLLLVYLFFLYTVGCVNFLFATCYEEF